MEILHVALGFCAGLIYAFLGYAAQNETFDWKKFLRTAAIGLGAALGLEITGVTFSVYTAIVGPTAIMVWLQKLIDTAKLGQLKQSPK